VGTVVLIAFAVVGAIAGIIIFRSAPRFALIAWTVVLFFVPIWVGFSISHFYSVITLATLLLVASSSARGFRFTKVDGVLLLFGVLITFSFLLGGVILGHLLIALLDWLLPYLLGRLILARVSMNVVTAAISVVTVIASVLALIEFATGKNIFVLIHFNNGGYALWSPLQPRGGFLRAEGAFGHSIALGASLAIGSVFILASRWKLSLRILALAVTVGAVIVTFSRIGLVNLALGLVLSVAFLAGVLTARTRLAVAAIAIVGALIIVPFVSEVFTAAGTEAAGSADYRLDLVSLISKMAPLGLSPSYQVLPDGSVYIGNFQSIDSFLILVGLRLGYIPLLLLLSLLVTAVIVMFRSKANAPLIALVAQIPTFLTADLITQLPYLVWFVGGLAVSLYILEHDRVRAPVVSYQGAMVPEGGRKTYG
jgi:hypothetical protein